MKTAALAGGVGGARLAEGLAQVLPTGSLTVIVNTGDDFEHYGLKVCPDLDTVCYTLAGLSNQDTGWGRVDESWNVLESLQQLGGPVWFQLGDRDLATHLERTRRLNHGERLSEITRHFCQVWGVSTTILPMSDDPVPTMVETESGWLSFQDYFVRLRCEPAVRGFRFVEVNSVLPAPGVLEALEEADIIVICPSNPWVSIEPVLSVPGVREVLFRKPVLAVSPIIGGKTVKGPAAKMFTEMGITPTAYAVAAYYGGSQTGGLLSGFVIDQVDASLKEQIEALGLQVLVTQTWMKSPGERRRLAEQVVAFGMKLARQETG